ncbi:FecR family protein [Niabella drilacis]|uniref:FecR family protein n=1 Tax=Niabella drilacis (strain DSM 25811 / CCM 8410 / CCUG 62505 / LMG 26954 / E90) TaxID=1285928 RepID=A0A1G6TC07_NIADE|nr:FecR family protein [Niabella drilacis]SDD26394.1 FecR family protein [Niabella drilacis]
MQQSSEHIISLWERYLSSRATRSEVDALFELVKDIDEELNYQYVKEAEQRLQQNSEIPVVIPEWMIDSILKEAAPVSRAAAKIRYLRHWYWAAAAVIIFLGIGLFYLDQQSRESAPSVAIRTPDAILAPVINRAMITLADGSKVYLDSAGNGQLAQQGNVKLIKLANGQIAYQAADGQILKKLQYNTLTNPKGSRVIDMMLSDGSHVWLNAGSSITYPVAFEGDERNVKLEGEGYFEVAKDPSKKFIVQAGNINTEVLGTHFNINAYNDEWATRVTLLEGSVKVSGILRPVSSVLRPGQQATLRRAQGDIVLGRPDLNQVMAWRNGVFYLNHQSIATVMQEVGNWYDVQIVYPSGVPVVELYGEIGRDLSLTQVIQALKVLGVTCRLEERKLIVGQ